MEKNLSLDDKLSVEGVVRGFRGTEPEAKTQLTRYESPEGYQFCLFSNLRSKLRNIAFGLAFTNDHSGPLSRFSGDLPHIGSSR